jgi:hypothetical protein
VDRNNQANTPSEMSTISIMSFDFLIPKNRFTLLYKDIKKDEYYDPNQTKLVAHSKILGDINLQVDEPSTILTKLRVTKPNNYEGVPHPDYYPSYKGLNPEQRWIYLDWLKDVSKKIYIGYVFIYYYGLERQLLFGNFNSAFDEIILLRNCHSDNSLYFYSDTSLLFSCLSRESKRYSEINRPNLVNKMWDIDLLYPYYLGLDLSADYLIQVARRIWTLEKKYRYVDKKDIELISSILSEVILREYGTNLYPFAKRFKLSDVPKKESLIYANLSLPEYIRTQSIPKFLSYKPFIDEVSSLIIKTHESIKNQKILKK